MKEVLSLDIVQKNGVLKKIESIFELGSGPARNLFYFNKKKPEIKLLCSDLFKKSSFENYSHGNLLLHKFYLRHSCRRGNSNLRKTSSFQFRKDVSITGRTYTDAVLTFGNSCILTVA